MRPVSGSCADGADGAEVAAAARGRVRVGDAEAGRTTVIASLIVRADPFAPVPAIRSSCAPGSVPVGIRTLVESLPDVVVVTVASLTGVLCSVMFADVRGANPAHATPIV